jgi:hypothetical protein
MGVPRLVSADSASGKLPDVVLYHLTDKFGDRAARPIHAYDYGVRAGTNTNQVPALKAAFDAAELAGGGMSVQLPPGVITIDGTFSLSGYSSVPSGSGASTRSAGSDTPSGTVLRAINQTGPVLDFTGWRAPRNFIGRVIGGRFTVEGDGTSGVAKKGIYVGDLAYGLSLRDITITRTGGIGLDMKDVYLSDFEAITITNPIDCVTNDVPYARLIGCNGIRMRGLGLRSLLTAGDVPPSGAFRIEASVFQFHNSLFDGCWIENLHPGTGRAIIVSQANSCVWSDLQVFDVFKESGASGTSIFRFENSTVLNGGGNVFRGVVPGKGTNALEVDTGIDVRQSWNRIEGTKGYRGANVTLATGVVGTTVFLGGSMGTSTEPAFIDNSGNATNTLIDAFSGSWVLGARSGVTPTLRIGGIDVRPGFIDAGTVTTAFNPNMGGGNNSFRFTLGASGLTVGAPSNSQARELILMLRQDGTGSRTVNWAAIYKLSGGGATLTAGVGQTDVFTFRFDGNNWVETARSMNV